jgi:sialidase-1
MRIRGFLLFVLGLVSPSSAAVEQRDVFVSGQERYHTYRIPSVVRLGDGALFALCEGRRNSSSDTGDIDLVSKRSTDGGRTWSTLRVIWDDGLNTCGNPCLLLDETTGTLWLFATHNLGEDNETDIIHKRAKGTRTPWVMNSRDGGLTWSEPQELTSSLKNPNWGWYATGPGIGIQIKHGPHAGRLVIPAVHSYDELNGQVRKGPYEYGSHVIYSDDHGATWKLGGLIQPKVNEGQVVELGGSLGQLQMNMRSYHGRNRRAESNSDDGGETWGPIAHDDALIEPVCQASLLRHAFPKGSGKSAILFSNPASERNRSRMTVRISYNDGRTWPRELLLHEAFSAYSCLVSLGPREAGCLYERGEGVGRSAYERITFARFSIKDLVQKNPAKSKS